MIIASTSFIHFFQWEVCLPLDVYFLKYFKLTHCEFWLTYLKKEIRQLKIKTGNFLRREVDQVYQLKSPFLEKIQAILFHFSTYLHQISKSRISVRCHKKYQTKIFEEAKIQLSNINFIQDLFQFKTTKNWGKIT